MILQKLDELKIPYQLYPHEPVQTMEDLAAIDETIGVPHCKNLFLCNRQETDFYLLLLQGQKAFRTASVSKQLGVSRLSFGSAENLWRLLRTMPGAISPLGLAFDTSHAVRLLIDRDLAGEEMICVHPLVNDASLVMRRSDLLGKFLDATGHRPIWVDIE
ncbi:MAG TPA: prolyl-tRNA synthetase associated domain-containing protein [Clostridiales bacterium]|nr:prolyl-tRNA synthetase associated domain-containing protein [Clostridiales bacterium]